MKTLLLKFIFIILCQITVYVSTINSWNSSSMDPGNWDGVYFVIKQKLNGVWTSIPNTLSINEAASSPAFPDVFGSGVGFILECEPSFCGTGIAFDHNLIFDLLAPLPFDIDLAIFGYEMVFVGGATSDPYLGDGVFPNESANAFHAIDNVAVLLGTPSITVDANSFDDNTLETGGINFGSPRGIDSYSPYFPHSSNFYMMKYEITQGAYRDFLNTLTYDQQVTRTANLPTSVIGTGALIASGTDGNYIEIAIPSKIGREWGQ